MQPQCFWTMPAPMPSMSAAGFERVKVTQRKLFSVRAVNSASSTTTIRGKSRIGSSGPNDAQNAAMPGSSRR